jgi:copper(I)-binding protein
VKRYLLLTIVVLAAACSGGDSSDLQLEDPWARPSPTGATTAAFFLTIDNPTDTDETLVSAATDACRVTELHLSKMTDGVMTMERQEGGILIPAAETVTLAPGGLHIMCIDRSAEFAEGEELDITLEFVDANGGSHTEELTAVVEDR